MKTRLMKGLACSIIVLAAAPPFTPAQQAVTTSDDPAYVQRTQQAHDLIEKARAMSQTNLKGAEALYEQAFSLDPNLNSAMIHNNLGSVLQSLGEMDRAQEEYLKALKFDPNLKYAKDNLRVIEINKLSDKATQFKLAGKYDQAIPLYKQAVQMDPHQPMSHNNLGTAYQASGQLDDAIREYQEALKIDPKMDLATMNLARTNLSHGNFDEAKKYFDRYLQLYPNGPSAEEARNTLPSLEQDKTDVHGDPNSPDYLQSATAPAYLRWAPDPGPIKVYIAPGDGIPGYQPQFRQLLINSFNTWTSSLHNRLTCTFVQQPEGAGITCGWAANNAQFHLIKNTANEQGEVSSYETFVRNGQRFIRHTSIAISTINVRTMKPMTDNEIADVSLHEVGHALGLVGHSPNYRDVMFFITNPGGGTALRSLTQRDVNTINALYKDSAPPQ